MQDLSVNVKQTAGVIECNFDEIEAALRNQMTAYADLEVTEENQDERKKDVAVLRKIKKAVDDKRKEVKRDFDAPLKEFEGKVKTLTGILDEQIDRINDGLTVFEQRRIAEKQAHIETLYHQEIGDLALYLPYEKIRQDRWNNKTCTDGEIISALQEMRLRVQNDLAAIKALGSEIEEKILAAYAASGNQLSVAIQRNTEYIEAKKAAEERVKAEAERKAREAEKAAEERLIENAREEMSDRIQADVDAHNENLITTDELEFSMNLPTLTITVTGLENIEALRTYLEMSGMEYEEIIKTRVM